MTLRLVEINISGTGGELVDDFLVGHRVIDRWQTEFSDDQTTVKILLPAEDAQGVLDELNRHFGSQGGFRAVLLPVEATLPRPDLGQRPNADTDIEQTPRPRIRGSRISREELYADVSGDINATGTFFTFLILSTVVAVIGLLKDSVAIIIGAMVIAPLLGPNVALALSVALGDGRLAWKAVKINILGVALALTLSVLAGLLVSIDPQTPEILSRTRADTGDVLLALAAGSAGVLAFTTGVASSLIGVMVAVALLPPLATAGLMLGSGNLHAALGAFLLLGTNIICVNLAGILTFIVQRVRPGTWWESQKARRAARVAILVWTSLLIALVTLMIHS